MQTITFQVPQYYDDVGFVIGGNGIDGKYCFLESFVIYPFPKDTLDTIRSAKGDINADETLQVAYGINNNYPLPPTLNFTGRMGAFMTPAYLNLMHTELTPVYGYPEYLNLPVWEYVWFMCKKANEFVESSPLYYEALQNIHKRLEEFALQVKKQGAWIHTIQLNLTGFSVAERQKIISQPFWAVQDKGNVLTQRQIVPALYLQPTHNLDVLEIRLPEPVLLSYSDYLRFKLKGNEDTTLNNNFDRLKHKPFSLSIWMNLYSSTDIDSLFEYEVLLQDPLHAPNFNLLKFVGITLQYELREPIKVSRKVFEPVEIEPENQTTEPEIKQETPTQEQETSPAWLWIIILFVVLLIIFKKVSE